MFPCRLLILALLLLLPAGMQAATSATATAAQIRQEEGPCAALDRMQHDFGRIDHTTHTAEFQLTNTGTAPLVIVRTETSCHCIELSYPTEPIRPRETRTITVRYTPDRKAEGGFSQYVRLFTNANTARPLMIFVRGDVVR